ncbi:CheD [Caldithrix abyssi DSM 13497]|uniref:Probable chemoreceptor glutamine deamidase CheD n=1 Tax=Caldithrix abyssi DSM 13497 TaxID=880073 RepID=H1XPB3_CALAY|nr:chemotaxis protein CheD [Caldithrix abyssi]APF18201.1 cheD CheD, stimulates methylation of MCP protein [Caldithrix abyssi DSM 13497]EHO42228.1 CheD [Caldithrix abyssi DSM 13497]
MAQLICGVGDIVISNRPEDSIKTFALGSCVAVIFYAPELKIAGMAHVALPDSTVNVRKAEQKPGYFADTAISHLIRKLKGMGIKKNGQIWIKLAGGANMLDRNGQFSIGKRNVLAIRKHLWRFKLGAIAEDVGFNYSRTVSVCVNNGKIVITSPGRSPKVL